MRLMGLCNQASYYSKELYKKQNSTPVWLSELQHSKVHEPSADTQLGLDWAQTHLDADGDRLAHLIEGAKLYALQILRYDEGSDRGPTGLLLVTKDEVHYRWIGMYTFMPPDEEKLEDETAISGVSGALYRFRVQTVVQRSAFNNCEPRYIQLQ